MRIVLINKNTIAKNQNKIIGSLLLNHFSGKESDRKNISRSFWKQIKAQTEEYFLLDNLYAILNDAIDTDEEMIAFLQFLELTPPLQKIINDILLDDTSAKQYEEEIDLNKCLNFALQKSKINNPETNIKNNRIQAEQKIKRLFLMDQNFIKQFLNYCPKTLQSFSAKALKKIIMNNNAAAIMLLKSHALKIQEEMDEQEIQDLLTKKIEKNQKQYFLTAIEACMSFFQEKTLNIFKRLLHHSVSTRDAKLGSELLANFFASTPNEELTAVLTKYPALATVLCERLSVDKISQLICLSKQPIRFLTTLTKNTATATVIVEKLLNIVSLLLPNLAEDQLNELKTFINKQYYFEQKNKIFYIDKLRKEFYGLLEMASMGKCTTEELQKIYNLLEFKIFRDEIKLDFERLTAMLKSSCLRSFADRIISEDENLWKVFSKQLLDEAKSEAHAFEDVSQPEFITAKLGLINVEKEYETKSWIQVKLDIYQAYLIAASPTLWNKFTTVIKKRYQHQFGKVLESLNPILPMKLNHTQMKESFKDYFVKQFLTHNEKMDFSKSDAFAMLQLFCHLADETSLFLLLGDKHSEFIRKIQDFTYTVYENNELVRDAFAKTDVTQLLMQILASNDYLWQKFQSGVNEETICLVARFLNHPKIFSLLTGPYLVAILNFYDKHLIRNEIKNLFLQNSHLLIQILSIGFGSGEIALAENALFMELLNSEKLTNYLNVDHYINLLNWRKNKNMTLFLQNQLNKNPDLCLQLLDDNRVDDISDFSATILDAMKNSGIESRLTVEHFIKLRALSSWLENHGKLDLNILTSKLSSTSKEYVIKFVINKPELFISLFDELAEEGLVQLIEDHENILTNLASENFTKNVTSTTIRKLLQINHNVVGLQIRSEIKKQPILIINLLKNSSVEQLNEVEGGLDFLFEDENVKKLIDFQNFQCEELARLLKVQSSRLLMAIVRTIQQLNTQTELCETLLALLQYAENNSKQLPQILKIVTPVIINKKIIIGEAKMMEIVRALIALDYKEAQALLEDLCKETAITEAILIAAANGDSSVADFAKSNSDIFFKIAIGQQLNVVCGENELKFLLNLQNKTISIQIFSNPESCLRIIKTDYEFTDSDLNLIYLLIGDDKSEWFLENAEFEKLHKPLQEKVKELFADFSENKIYLVHLFNHPIILHTLFVGINAKQIQEILNTDERSRDYLFRVAMDNEQKPTAILKNYLRGLLDLPFNADIFKHVLEDSELPQYVFENKSSQQLYQFFCEARFGKNEYEVILKNKSQFLPLLTDKKQLLELFRSNKVFASVVINNYELLNSCQFLDEDFYQVFLNSQFDETVKYILQNATDYTKYYLQKIYISAPGNIQQRIKNTKFWSEISQDLLPNQERSQESKAEIIQTKDMSLSQNLDPNQKEFLRFVNLAKSLEEQDVAQACQKYLSATSIDCENKNSMFEFQKQTGDLGLYLKAIQLAVKNKLENRLAIIKRYLQSDKVLTIASILPAKVLLNAEIYNFCLELISTKPQKIYNYLMSLNYDDLHDHIRGMVYSRIGSLMLKFVNSLNWDDTNHQKLLLPLLEKMSIAYPKELYNLICENKKRSHVLFTEIYGDIQKLLPSLTQPSHCKLNLIYLKAFLQDSDMLSNNVGLKKVVDLIAHYQTPILDKVLLELEDFISADDLLSTKDSDLIASFLRSEIFCTQLENEKLLQLLNFSKQGANMCFIYPHLFKKLNNSELLTAGKTAGYQTQSLQNFLIELGKSSSLLFDEFFGYINEKTPKNTAPNSSSALIQILLNGHGETQSEKIPEKDTQAKLEINGKDSVIVKKSFTTSFFWQGIQPEPLVPCLSNALVEKIISAAAASKTREESIKALTFLVTDKDASESLDYYMGETTSLFGQSDLEAILPLFNKQIILKARDDYQQQGNFEKLYESEFAYK